MKTILLISALIAACLAAPQGGPAAKDAAIVKFESDNIGLGGYNFLYETSNGISQHETGQLQNAGSENEIMAVQGEYSYTGDDGVLYKVTYTADANGFQAQGAHIPH